MMLVAGTASIRGEESVHIGDLGGQLRETFLNLGILIKGPSPDGPAKVFDHEELAPYLARMTEVRIYYPRPLDEPVVRTAAEGVFSRARTLQLLRADLCRSELLVEIEGVASLED
jgi:hypothetical protein